MRTSGCTPNLEQLILAKLISIQISVGNISICYAKLVFFRQRSVEKERVKLSEISAAFV